MSAMETSDAAERAFSSRANQPREVVMRVKREVAELSERTL